MSERAKGDNARRRGKRDFCNGVPLDANPMRARDSRENWRRAWIEEEAETERYNAVLARQLKERREALVKASEK